MSWERVAQAKVIFEKVFEAPEQERDTLLRKYCAKDGALREEVEALLVSHAAATEFLKESLPSQLMAETGSASPGPATSRRIGIYRILRPLGHGGMASVYLAKRTDGLHEQEVALKVMDRAYSTAETEVRFRREVKALSKLIHPNIVRMLDGGITEDGLLFVVMEFVDGKRLDAFSRDNTLSIGDRVRLFLQISDAVAFAHRNLVVHRDLKPQNILVTGDGTPKLLDFGIAKLLDEAPAERFTSTGFRRMTLEYASPEQLRAEPTISTSTDIYSLGVLLYELLTDRLPYGHQAALPHRIAQAVLEEEPAPAAGLPSELSAIVMMALRKEPERRYASVDYLRDDLGRYLAGLPVTAFRDSAWYRWKKFVQRRRRPVATGLVAALIVLIASIIAIQQARKADSRLKQLIAFSESTQLDLLPNLYGIAGTLPTQTSVNAKRVEFLEMMVRERDDVSLRPRLIYALLMYSTNLSNLYGLQVGDTRTARTALERALHLAEADWRIHPQGKEENRNLAHALNYLAKNLVERGQSRQAAESLERAVAVQQRFLAARAHTSADEEILALSLSMLGERYAEEGQRDRSLDCHRRALAIRTANLGGASEFWGRHKMMRHRAEALSFSARSRYRLGLFDDALSDAHALIKDERQLLSEDAQSTVSKLSLAHGLRTLAAIQYNRGALRAAESVIRESLDRLRALGQEERGCWRVRRETGLALGLLASISEKKGDIAKAIASLKEQRTIAQAAVEKDTESVLARQELEGCNSHLSRMVETEVVIRRGPSLPGPSGFAEPGVDDW